MNVWLLDETEMRACSSFKNHRLVKNDKAAAAGVKVEVGLLFCFLFGDPFLSHSIPPSINQSVSQSKKKGSLDHNVFSQQLV